MIDTTACLGASLEAAHLAGRRILAIYQKPFGVATKADQSPVTAADRAAHRVIVDHLIRPDLPSLPVLSEEGKAISYELRKQWEYFWLVDPLDGTKEFIKRNGEFTVNIALVKGQHPVLGVIYIPVSQQFYFAAEGLGAYTFDMAAHHGSRSPGPSQGPIRFDVSQLLSRSTKLAVAAPPGAVEGAESSALTIVGSRSHANEALEAYVRRQKQTGRSVTVVAAGSALKFCRVAEGRAHVYPRFGPTMEWDTAAGQVIVEQAGGSVTEAKDKTPLIYNKENLLNPWFIARAQPAGGSTGQSASTHSGGQP